MLVHKHSIRASSREATTVVYSGPITVISGFLLFCRVNLVGPVRWVRFLDLIPSRWWRCKTHWQWYVEMWQCWVELSSVDGNCWKKNEDDTKMLNWIEMFASMKDESTQAEYESGHSTTHGSDNWRLMVKPRVSRFRKHTSSNLFIHSIAEPAMRCASHCSGGRKSHSAHTKYLPCHFIP